MLCHLSGICDIGTYKYDMLRVVLVIIFEFSFILPEIGYSS